MMFKSLKEKVGQQFNSMVDNQLYVVGLEKNVLFDAYIAALPEEERASHICNSCRHFLNKYGALVNIVNDKLVTVWDFEVEAPYENIPKVLGDLIRSKPITEVFLSDVAALGTDTNYQRYEDGTVVLRNHFFGLLPRVLVTKSADSLDMIQSKYRATYDVYKRSLETITPDAVQTVLDLISENNLYRGKEFEDRLLAFQKNQKAWNKSKNKDLFVWSTFKEGGKVRNSEIGTLLVDLSEGKELDQAVKLFEKIVTPANYKRPTSLVTAKMIATAQETIEKLGAKNSLQRRHANKDDIKISDLLFVNRDSDLNDVFASMVKDVSIDVKTLSRVKTLTLENFIKNVLPTATSMEVLVENSSNFMSLIAPVDPDSKNIFSWDNQISWTYQNNMADAIKEKVKEAGGSIEGELRVSIAWYNYDDLDLHLIEPDGEEISFRHTRSSRGGVLDVDMNAGSGKSRSAVENIVYSLGNKKMKEGVYTVKVMNFAKRENIDLGYQVQIESNGKIYDLTQSRAIPDRSTETVASFTYSNKTGISNMATTLVSKSADKETNGVRTNRFHKVNMMMYSPNYWSTCKGNQHLFFILDGSKVDNTLRPFFNEYLSPEFNEHRKVLEILGSKLMVPVVDQQLTGIGFSLTQQAEVFVKVNGEPMKINL